MDMITTTDRNRHPAGVPVGGQFAAMLRPPAAVGLEVPSDHLNRLFRHSHERLVALENLPSGGDQLMGARLRAQALAAAVRDTFPGAATVVLEESDQEGSSACWVKSVLDAGGEDLAEEYPEFGGYEDDLNHVLSDFQLRYAAPSVTRNGNDRYGYTYRVDLDTALTEAPEADPIAAAADRGDSVIEHYRAHYAGLDQDEDPDVKVRDMLTDLHHWADSRGLDLAEAFARAADMADEERREQDPIGA